MDFDISEDQQMLSQSVARLLADRYGFEARRSYRSAEPGFSEAMWQHYAELGLLGLPFSDEDGGFGGDGIHTMLVMEHFGRHLILEPYLGTVVLCGGAVALAGNEQQKRAMLPRIAGGQLKLAFAHSEPLSRYRLADVVTTARRGDTGWTLDGVKSLVAQADSADRIVVSARSSGGRFDEQGITLFLVDPHSAGVTLRPHAMRDGTRAAEVGFTGAAVAGVLGEVGKAYSVLTRVSGNAIAALTAEAVGAMSAMYEMTLDYIKLRTQFGRPIGQNQALQHKAVDMLVALEQARSMAMYAAMSVELDDEAERTRRMAMAKCAVDQWGRFVAQTAMQLHGGIALTDEYAIGHYFRRLMAIEHSFGDSRHHLAALAAAS